MIEGRSDATLKPSGHRIGTAEVYRQIERLPDIRGLGGGGGSAGTGRARRALRPAPPGVWAHPGAGGEDRGAVANATPFHAPARIVAVTGHPAHGERKKAELSVRAVIEDEPVKNAAALANPEALSQYRSLAVLRT